MSQDNSKKLLDFIRTRRSIRRYRLQKPPISMIDQLIDSASCAPSAHNAQPWRFYVIEDDNNRTKLISEMGNEYKRALRRDGISKPIIEKRVSRSMHRFSEAPYLIIAYIDISAMKKYHDSKRRKVEMSMATQSLSAAIENLLLAATALELGGCWYCAPLFCPEIVKKILGLNANQYPQALVTIGYPAESPTKPPRLDRDEIRFIL